MSAPTPVSAPSAPSTDALTMAAPPPNTIFGMNLAVLLFFGVFLAIIFGVIYIYSLKYKSKHKRDYEQE